jgi:hypothetical protein
LRDLLADRRLHVPEVVGGAAKGTLARNSRERDEVADLDP